MLETFTVECVGLWVERLFFSLSLGLALSKLRVWALPLGDSIHSLSGPNSILWHKVTAYNKTHLFIIQIYFHAENTCQISYCSNQGQKSFPLYFQIQNNIPKLSAQFAVTACFENPNMVWPLAIRDRTWSSQTVLCENKNLIFHINPIQTAVN